MSPTGGVAMAVAVVSTAPFVTAQGVASIFAALANLPIASIAHPAYSYSSRQLTRPQQKGSPQRMTQEDRSTMLSACHKLGATIPSTWREEKEEGVSSACVAHVRSS
jgi:hypothetical protein